MSSQYPGGEGKEWREYANEATNAERDQAQSMKPINC